ncbi:MAG: GcrA cell cycle regulator [Acetobacteraceae bacterium]|nr:GcrA cell cycle regulator [Acetobacteraceae bacterium]
MAWGDDTVSRLRSLWEEGHSTSEIGRRLGVSKNAVIGKARRLKLSRRPSPIRPAGSGCPRQSRRRAVPKLTEIAPLRRTAPKPSLAAPAPPPPLVPRSLPRPPVPAGQSELTPPSLRRGTALCCWPLGEPGTHTFRFCDAPALAHKPYCQGHCALAYQKQHDRRDQTA